MKKIKKLGVIAMITSLLGCSTDINAYKDTKPTLNLKEYLQGHISGTGIIQDWKGKVTRQFQFHGDANWNNNIGFFDEYMTYNDGSKDHRIWKIVKIDNHNYEATTDDVIDKAIIRIEGNAMNWKYQMRIPVGDNKVTINFDDWMYLTEDNALINKNTFKKFGLKVGSLTLFMKKGETKNEKSE